MIILMSLSAIALSIVVLAIITDEFFIPSLEQISTRWKLPPDVAGASLMAMGSSAPELSIALLALFKEGGAHGDVGIGTIVGSAVFNILVITGICAIVKDARIKLPAVIRDTVFYLFSIGCLLYAFWDGEITFNESLLFLGVYAAYLLFLFFAKMEDDPGTTAAPEKKETNAGGKGVLRMARRAVGKAIGVLAGDARESYLRAFGVSILLIASISWLLVDCTVIFADAVGLPPVIVALTLLAGGTSAPDLIASIVVVRQGRGSMAVANAIGSNIFDILIGLGLPWMIALLFLGKSVVHVGAEGLMVSVFILVSTVVILFVFLFTDRLLSKKEGWCLLALYIAYVVYTVIVG
ncbi:MAG: calcium/sodium antiporter [Desulfobacterales bacterium]|nr:calcium/sodium antiporter [Desulfobacterales bacterium]